jgi:hypothetical protein
MKKILLLKILIVIVGLCGAAYFFTGCCSQKCCSPSIEVGVIPPNAPYNHYTYSNIRLWTWDPITRYPQSPNIEILGYSIDAFKPYLVETQVQNFSDVAVRDVAVGFYWAYAGWFDTGVPIGVTSVNLTPKQIKWVRSPTTVPLSGPNPFDMCLAVRIFHPCDTDTENNWFWKNFTIRRIILANKVAVFTFTVDFNEFEGRLTYKVDTKADVQTYIMPRVFENEMITAKDVEGVKSMPFIEVKKGVPQKLSLVVDYSKMNLKVGDTFDVTAIAMDGDKEVNQFTVQFKVEK